MSRTRRAPHAPASDAQISDDHDVTGPKAEDAVDATEDRGRRWYHLRPKPRRGTDFMGFNSTWWMALAWFALLIVVAFPFPWGW
jgi:hypothetical protein